MLSDLKYGQGLFQKGEYKAAVNKKATKEYVTWYSMIVRCYSEKFHNRKKSYKDCTVSDNFKNFQYFAEWCQSQAGFGVVGYALDKDILSKNNRVYSEDLCVFVPRKLNNFFVRRKPLRGCLPIGVSMHREMYQAKLSDGEGITIHLGIYSTPEEAFTKYKQAKESLAKQLAVQYEGTVDKRVIDCLMAFKVEITD